MTLVSKSVDVAPTLFWQCLDRKHGIFVDVVFKVGLMSG